jgi:hypothetical protein
MGGRHIAVRVIGIASTAHGFAFAVLEGPGRLVDWGVYRVHSAPDAVKKAFDRTLVKNRPLFIALDRKAAEKKRSRGRLFVEAVEVAAAERAIMILDVESGRALESAAEGRTKWDVAAGMAKLFQEVAHKLPERRRPWQSEDDRVGLFIALASSLVAWRNFRAPRP